MLMYILTGVLLLFLIYLFVSMRMRNLLYKNLQGKNKELTLAKETAEESVKAKSDFFSTVSHEMRTPLYGVTGMVDVLQSTKAADDFKEEFNSLRFSAEHLLDVINDLLELSKLDDKTFELNNQPFELENLMREIIKSFERSHIRNTNTIHYVREGECHPFLIGDNRRIAQVLLNLLSNAIKFTTDGDIYLRLICTCDKVDEQEILFEIEDTGMGIPQDKLEAIFTEFNQVLDKEVSNQKVGTGLGLAIVKKILKKLNTEIRVESEVGKGSKFSFKLIFKVPENPDLVKNTLIINRQWDESSQGILIGAHILVVDDNKVNRLVTKLLLENQNIKVSLSSGGHKALQMLKVEEVDLILLDLHMPEIDGFDTALAIRDFDKNTPIVALTASEIDPIKTKLSACGFNDYISKPFNVKQFYRTLAKNIILNKNLTGVTNNSL